MVIFLLNFRQLFQFITPYFLLYSPLSKVIFLYNVVKSHKWPPCNKKDKDNIKGYNNTLYTPSRESKRKSIMDNKLNDTVMNYKRKSEYNILFLVPVVKPLNNDAFSDSRAKQIQGQSISKFQEPQNKEKNINVNLNI